MKKEVKDRLLSLVLRRIRELQTQRMGFDLLDDDFSFLQSQKLTYEIKAHEVLLTELEGE